MNKSDLTLKLKTNYGLYERMIQKFVYTDFYLILVALIVFIGWVSRSAEFGFCALVLLSCFVLIGVDDILPLTVNIFSAALMIFSDDLNKFLFMWPTFIPLGLSVAVFVVKNFRHKFTLGKMFFPQIAVTAALLLGGAGVVEGSKYLRALPDVLVLGVGVLAVYMLYNHFLKRDEKRDIPLYFAKTMMYIGIVISLELIVCIIRSGLSPSQWHTSYWDTGWGNRNNIATYLIFTAGLTMYLSTRYRKGWIFLALGLFQYVCIIMSFSRGGIIFGGISGLIALILTVIKAPDRRRQLMYVGIIFAAALLLYLVFMERVNDMIGSLIERGMGTSGRTELYIEAWERFKEHPFQGAGMGYEGYNDGQLNVIGLYWFHSTFFQIIGCMGVIGILAYAFYYIVRFGILFKNIKSAFNLFVLAVWIGFEGYSVIDTGTMVPYPNMMLVIIMTLLLERTMHSPDRSYVTAYNCSTKRGAEAARLRELEFTSVYTPQANDCAASEN